MQRHATYIRQTIDFYATSSSISWYQKIVFDSKQLKIAKQGTTLTHWKNHVSYRYCVCAYECVCGWSVVETTWNAKDVN